MMEAGANLTISQENFLCYFILHMQVNQSEASESTLNEKKTPSNCYDSHLTNIWRERKIKSFAKSKELQN